MTAFCWSEWLVRVVGKSNKGSKRLLDLRGNVWWFRMAIPAACRDYFGGKTMYLQSLETGDVRQAASKRDVLEREVRDLFARVKAGDVITSSEAAAEERGRLYREAIAAARQSGDADALEATVWAAEAEAVDNNMKAAARERFARALAGDHPVDHYFEAYLTSIKLAPKTTNERRGVLNRFARWCLAEKLRLPDITRRVAVDM